MLRAEAKKKKMKTYYTGIPCVNGHLVKRRTANGSCCECVRIVKYKSYPLRRDRHIVFMREYYKSNKKKLNQYSREYYRQHVEHLCAWSRNNYRQFREWYIQYNKKYYHNNKPYFERHNKKYYQQHLDYFINYWSVNAGKYNAYTARRRAAIKQAIPLWANLKQIQEIYLECVLTSKQTGIDHNVDHIIPLQGKRVCGLHCEQNLRIITADKNKKKSNKFT